MCTKSSRSLRPETGPGSLFDFLILSLIVVNVLVIIIESTEGAASPTELPSFYWRFEVFSVVIFTAEYLLRIRSCVEGSEVRRPFHDRLRFATSPMAIIDLLAIAPLPWRRSGWSRSTCV